MRRMHISMGQLQEERSLLPVFDEPQCSVCQLFSRVDMTIKTATRVVLPVRAADVETLRVITQMPLAEAR